MPLVSRYVFYSVKLVMLEFTRPRDQRYASDVKPISGI